MHFRLIISIPFFTIIIDFERLHILPFKELLNVWLCNC